MTNANFYITPIGTHRLLSLLLLCLLIVATTSYADTLTANVDRTSISLQDTFTLTLRASGQTGRSEPDFSVLQRDFDILSNQRGNQMRVINNQMESWTEWRLILSPKRTGQLTIPPFELNGQRSNPISIDVLQHHQINRGALQDIFIELDLDKETLYVQEQLLFTVRLYTSVNLRAVELQPLELPDAVIVEVAENRFHREVDGKAHAVIENTFAIFPQSSGELVIPSLTYNVSVSGGQRDIWGNVYGGNRNLQRLRTEEQRLHVNRIPREAAGHPWLPANSLSLEQHWSSSPDNLRVGEPVTRTLTLNAQGLSAGQLPPLTIPDVEGLNYYPDQPQTDEQRNAQGIRSKRIETLALVPQQSGTLTLPAVTVNWWNTNTGKMETARLPEAKVTVLAAPGSPKQASGAPNEHTPVSSGNSHSPTVIQESLPRWWWLSNAALILVSLALGLLYLNTRQRLLAMEQGQEATEQESENTEATVWKRLKRASANQDHQGFRRELIRWAKLHWQNEQLHSLQDIVRQTSSDPLRQELQAFDAALYRNNEKETFDCGALLQQVQKLRKEKRDKKDIGIEQPLKPLYPN